MPYRLKFDKEKCIGCYACHIACLDAHHSVGEIVTSFRAFQKVTDLSGTFEKTVCPGCIHCGKCAKACQMEVNPVENPNSAECIRCGRCKKACPTQAIQCGVKR